jgi:predicted metal-dependent hydrolase
LIVAVELLELPDLSGPMTYELQRTGRRRTVGISVEPDRRIVVLAPKGADRLRIEEILRRRLPWIRRQRRTLESLPSPPTPRQWVAGETHRYLGRQYRLRLVKASDASVKLVAGYFVVDLPDPKDRLGIKRLMEAWFRENAYRVLTKAVERILHSTTWLDVAIPPITVRAMRQRWGSTTSAGRIMFNIDLIKVPLGCIEYVVAHELVHLAIPNHGPAFWRMLTRCLPEWKKWRDRLTRVEV